MQVSKCLCGEASNLQWRARENKEFIMKHGKRKAFHVGSNSSCHQHIRSHYELYQAWCAEKNIPTQPHTIPQELLNAKQQLKKSKKEGNGQMSIQGMVENQAKLQETFSKDEVPQKVAELIVIDDQVSPSE